MSRRPLWTHWRWWLWVYRSAAGGWWVTSFGHGFHIPERTRPATPKTFLDYLEIATLVVGHRKLGLARYRNAEATTIKAAAAAFAAPNFNRALDELERVITEAELDAEVFYWDGSERTA